MNTGIQNDNQFIAYSNVTRSPEYLTALLNHIRREYSLEPVRIAQAKRGFYGETWLLDTANANFFLKLSYASSQMKKYECSFIVMDYLATHGIDFVSKIVKTTNGKLYTHFDGAVLGVFEWIDGKNVQNEQTKVVGFEMLAKIYAVQTERLEIAYEKFSALSSKLFFQLLKQLKPLQTDSNIAQILNILEKHGEEFSYNAQRLELFAQKCSSDNSHFVITHSDVGGNIITDGKHYTIVDWDGAKLAPPERDAWMYLYFGWETVEQFNAALHRNNVDYTLRPERLAYYTYNMYFQYINFCIQAYLDTGDSKGLLNWTNNYFYVDDWVMKIVKIANETIL